MAWFRRRNPFDRLPDESDTAWHARILARFVDRISRDYGRHILVGRLLQVLLLVYLIGLPVYLLLQSPALTQEAHVAVVDVQGLIAVDANTNSRAIKRALRRAFESEQSQAVLLYLNSPGGSPVESDDIWRYIRYLRQEYPDKALHAVVGEVCASGCYYIASAADEIHANRSSLIGSIGVVMQNFGLVDLLERLGIESRTLHAGDNKTLLSPFETEDPEQVAHVQQLLDEVHGHFIEAVRAGRGDRLNVETPGLFSGLIWSGQQALNIGLIDGFGDIHEVARERFNSDELRLYNSKAGLLERLGRLINSQLNWTLPAFILPSTSMRTH